MSRGQTTDQQRLDRDKNRERREEYLARSDLIEVMSGPAGRRFMYRLIFGTCGLQNVYLAQDSGIYKHEGRRAVGAELVRELQMNHPEAYVLMLTERMQDLKHAAQVREEPKRIGDDT